MFDIIEKIEVIPDTFASDVFFWKEMDFTKLPNKKIVPLFGPNGIGKSTLIKEILGTNEGYVKGIKSTTDGKNMMMYSYSNSVDNLKNRKPRSIAESYDPFLMACRFEANSISEGQSVIYSAFDLLDGLKPGSGSFASDDAETLILIDEIDSGLSIDNIDLAMEKIKSAITKRDDIQVIMSFNSPRVLKHFPYVISMYDGSVLELHTDEDMLAEIKRHKKDFDKIRKDSSGRPKVFW